MPVALASCFLVVHNSGTMVTAAVAERTTWLDSRSRGAGPFRLVSLRMLLQFHALNFIGLLDNLSGLESLVGESSSVRGRANEILVETLLQIEKKCEELGFDLAIAKSERIR